jgi:hypothetical protein
VERVRTVMPTYLITCKAKTKRTSTLDKGYHYGCTRIQKVDAKSYTDAQALGMYCKQHKERE